MSKELRVLSDISWPGAVRLPVALTFEVQAGEGVPRLPGDRPNAMVGGAIEYGARVGVWNILEVLEEAGAKGTFFVCGTTALAYPEMVRAIHAAGHELAGMSYGFERVRTMSPKSEREMVRRAADTLRQVAGADISGWRCPDYRVSPHTLDILSLEGLSWDSSLLNDDYPTLFACANGELVELPFTTSTADKTFIGYPYPQRGGPQGLGGVWESELAVLHREAEGAPRFMILSIQAWATGRPAPLHVLRQFIGHVAAQPGTSFVTCGQLDDWSRAAVTEKRA